LYKKKFDRRGKKETREKRKVYKLKRSENFTKNTFLPERRLKDYIEINFRDITFEDKN
jgi:hypothetical protein